MSDFSVLFIAGVAFSAVSGVLVAYVTEKWPLGVAVAFGLMAIGLFLEAATKLKP